QTCDETPSGRGVCFQEQNPIDFLNSERIYDREKYKVYKFWKKALIFNKINTVKYFHRKESLLFVFLEDNRGIMPTKPKGITLCNFNISLLSFIKGEV